MSEPSKLTKKFCVFHQRHFRESSNFFKGGAPAEEPVIAEACAQEETGIVRERVG